MKKLMKLLALALAAVMLLPTAALAAENGDEGPVLVCDRLEWDGEHHFINEECLTNDNGARELECNPYNSPAVMFFVLENGKKTPILPNRVTGKITALPMQTIEPELIAPNAKESEYYVRVQMQEEFKDGAVTAEYNGQTLSLPVTAALDDLAMYTKPEAAPENMAGYAFDFSPLLEESFCYLISTATDENNGRHLVDMALNEDCEDNAAFQLEKVSDGVYKLTLTGSVDTVEYFPVVDVTWQNAKFTGGDTYVEQWDFHAWEGASTLVTGLDMMEFDMSTPTLYQDVTDDFKNTMTLKAGESKTVYIAFTNFVSESPNWTIKRYGAAYAKTDDKDLKLTTDEDNPTKLTVSCDVPGTYTFTIDGSYWWPSVHGLTHANGKPYTEAEFQKWDEETFYTCDIDTFYIVSYDEDNNRTLTPFEEAFPGETIDWAPHYEPSVFVPVTVTVEAAAPAFTDVKEGDWYEAAVRFVNGKGYMNGSNNKFNPEGKITGAEFSQLLYNKAGQPAAADGASFQGVAGAWYEPAMLWAAGEGIISDTGDAAVQPEKELTRQQLAVMLYNSLGKPEGTAGLTAFADADQISAWAKPAMEWAVSAKVFNGSTQGGKQVLNPTGTASRAEVAQLLLNYFGS